MPQMRKTKKKTAGLTFNHAMVYVQELEPALHFYRDLLGFKMIEQYATAYARLRSPRGNGTLALHRLEPGHTVPPDEGVRLYFETTALDRLCKDLESAGVTFSAPPKLMPWGWKHAYLNDPDGHEVSLYTAGAKRFRKSIMRSTSPSAR